LTRIGQYRNKYEDKWEIVVEKRDKEKERGDETENEIEKGEK
jgi:hypothetical protein